MSGILLSSTQADAPPQPDVIIYCDEAGNSGPNYLDPAQPFYVLAAWAVPVARVADVAGGIELLRQRLSPQATELKSTRLLQNDSGKQAVTELFTKFGSYDCIPLIVIAEKRYCIAGKIIETFADPQFNKRVSNAFIPDTTTKREIANALYTKLGDEELAQFATVYREPSVDGFRRALQIIVDAVRTRINPDLANVFDGSRENIEEIARTEESSSIPGDFSATLNAPALSCMFMMVEAASRKGLFRPTKFVHDENRPYETGFKHLFLTLRHAGEHVFEYPNGGLQIFPLRSIPDFEVGSSSRVLGIQAADLLAGSVRQWAQLASRREKATSVERELAMMTFPLLLLDEPKTAWSIGSDRWYESIGMTICQSDASPPAPAEHERITANDSLPLFPPIASLTPENDHSERISFKLPLFALVGERSRDLLCLVQGEDTEKQSESATWLFWHRETAEQFIESIELAAPDERFCVVEFGPARAREFVWSRSDLSVNVVLA